MAGSNSGGDHLHLVLGERACLVRADGGCVAHDLAGLEMPHEVVVPKHTRSGESQREGHSQRETFRYGNDNDGHHDDEDVEELLALLGRREIGHLGEADAEQDEKNDEEEQAGSSAKLSDVLSNDVQLGLEGRDFWIVVQRHEGFSVSRVYT